MANLFGNTPGFNTQLPRFSPESQNLLNQVIGQAGTSLGNINQMTPQFGPIAQKAMTQFNQETVPSIAERFTRMGAQGSGAFARNLGSAGANLQESLAAMEQGFNERQQGRNDNLLGMLLNAGLQPSFENIYTPAQPGFGTQIAPYLGSAGTGLMDYFSRGAQGAATGGAIGGLPGAGIGALISLLQQYISGGQGGQGQQNNLSQFRSPTSGYFPLQ